MKPSIVFRADASLDMGTGHVMRCLTLADSLKEKGVVCHFLCREHKGNLIEYIRNKGFFVYVLPMSQKKYIGDVDCLAHAPWLGASQIEDAEQCSVILQKLDVTWMIVDHYALDENWEQSLKTSYKQLMVIDDLADRKHCCDLLLDQTYGQFDGLYSLLVPDFCKRLIGVEYALLRPEFNSLREYSLNRRRNNKLNHILITMGGVDKDNVTGAVLESLRYCNIPEGCIITVVMGAHAPWLDDVKEKASMLTENETSVLVNVRDMASLMAACDFAIGAAGSTTWERCCLGLPSALIAIAENQEFSLSVLADQGIAYKFRLENIEQSVIDFFEMNDLDSVIRTLSDNCRKIVDGTGVAKVIREMGSLHEL